MNKRVILIAIGWFLYSTPFLVALATILLIGGEHYYWAVGLPSFYVGVIVGIKLVFWRHLGRLLSEDEKNKILVWFLVR